MGSMYFLIKIIKLENINFIFNNFQSIVYQTRNYFFYFMCESICTYYMVYFVNKCHVKFIFIMWNDSKYATIVRYNIARKYIYF